MEKEEDGFRVFGYFFGWKGVGIAEFEREINAKLLEEYSDIESTRCLSEIHRCLNQRILRQNNRISSNGPDKDGCKNDRETHRRSNRI